LEGSARLRRTGEDDDEFVRLARDFLIDLFARHRDLFEAD
jgi:hypothetical protein